MRKKIKRHAIKLVEYLFEDILFRKKNVNGVGVGLKAKDGRFTDNLCVFVTVEKKEELSELDKKDVIPERFFGFQTDVFPIGKLEEKSDWRGRHRPRKLGASCSWEGLTACSDGLPIWDKNDPDDELGYTLANGHCIYAHGRADVGDQVLQPSPNDGGKKDEDKVGEVTDMNFEMSADLDDNIDMSIFKNTVKMDRENVAGTTYIPETRYLNEGDVGKEVEGGGRTVGKEVTGILINIDFTAQARDDNGNIRKYKQCALALNSDTEGNHIVLGGDSSSIRFVDNMPLLQTFLGSEIAAVFNQVQKSLDYAKKEWGKEFVLTPPEKKHEGYVAVNPEWLTDEEVSTRLNLRETPGIKDNIIKTLPEGAKIETDADYEDGHFWIKVREK